MRHRHIIVENEQTVGRILHKHEGGDVEHYHVWKDWKYNPTLWTLALASSNEGLDEID